MTSFFFEASVIMVVFLFGSVGEIITEKSGHLNLGTPGIMCIGGAGAIIGTNAFIHMAGVENVVAGQEIGFFAILVPVLFGLVFSLLTGLLYCFVVDTLRCNQNVTGLIITIFGGGFLKFIGSVVYPPSMTAMGTSNPDRMAITEVARRYYQRIFPEEFVEANWFTKIFLGHGFLFYVAIAIAIAAFFIIKKTRVGLSLRAVGENPGTSDASGVNVTKYKYLATLIGSGIAGLGGVYYFLEKNAGSGEFGIEAYGWIAVALVIFAIWNTGLSVAGSLLFAMLYQWTNKSSISGWPKYVVQRLPYLITILVLIAVSLLRKRETQPPSALGLSYYREDR